MKPRCTVVISYLLSGKIVGKKKTSPFLQIMLIDTICLPQASHMQLSLAACPQDGKFPTARFSWRFQKWWDCVARSFLPRDRQTRSTIALHPGYAAWVGEVLSQAGKTQAISIIYTGAQLNESDTKLSPSVEQTVLNCWTKGYFRIWQYTTEAPYEHLCKAGICNWVS